MQDLPHLYAVEASSMPTGAVAVKTEEGATMQCFPPSHFGGDKGTQSPEYLLSEAVASCYILSFRAVSSASKLPWINLHCEAIGKLDKVERKLVFTEYRLSARLQVEKGVNQQLAQKLLEKAEQTCLISNSLSCPVLLKTEIEFV